MLQKGDYVVVTSGQHRGLAGKIRCRRRDGLYVINIFAPTGVPASPAVRACELRVDKKRDRIADSATQR